LHFFMAVIEIGICPNSRKTPIFVVCFWTLKGALPGGY